MLHVIELLDILAAFISLLSRNFFKLAFIILYILLEFVISVEKTTVKISDKETNK